ncbi:Nitroreductase-like protein [Lipomyces japonicus]|uniref:Nitroreductase-like protein n=1 Tax=Lipomyces japonicus TaxID=56871 RepID=UPI0034CE50E7
MYLPRLYLQRTSHALSRLSRLSRSSSKLCTSQFVLHPTRYFSSSSFPMSSSNTDALVEVAKARRSYYKLGKTSPVSDAKVEELVNNAILYLPSSFNTQSTRVVVVVNDKHDKLWDIAIEQFGNLVKSGAISEDQWNNQTLPKLQGFKAAYGTILFYEDPAHIAPYSEKFAAFKDKFPIWADHANAIHQWFLWAGLESLGFGANLQHYNPVIDTAVAKEFDVPSDWRLISQLVFGSIEGPAGEKQSKPLEERIKFLGGK